jgi:hypothetical protein
VAVQVSNAGAWNFADRFSNKLILPIFSETRRRTQVIARQSLASPVKLLGLSSVFDVGAARTRLEPACAPCRPAKGGFLVRDLTRLLIRGACLAALGIVFLTPGPAARSGEQYEPAPTFTAAQVLPPSLLHSPYYTVESHVGLEKFQYVFHVDTRWGRFRILGTDLLRLRAREMAATAQLAKIGGAETLVESAGKTALRPVETAKDLVTAPVKTIGDTFRGVGHMFGSVSAGMSATDPHKEGLIASVTGGATARRKLAYDFGVDPHTSFPPLDAQLTRLATASAVGETTANAGLSFVTGGAGIAISVGGTSNQLREALRDKTATDLEHDGRLALARMGVSDAAVNAFYANPNLTPTDKAIIVDALDSLGPIGGQGIFIASAARANSTEMGFFYRHQAELIADFGHRIAPVHRFVRLGGAPMVETAKGTISILPVDYLYWSPPLDALISGANRQRGKGPAQLWVTGRASSVAVAKLAALGWDLRPHVGPQLGE